jgi:hypothetical protein
MGSHTRTAIPADVADELLQRMAAEPISQGVIRMMAPDSVFLPAIREIAPDVCFVPTTLPPSGEITGARFHQPADPAWQELHAMPTRSLRTRAFMSLKAWNFALSNEPISV